jgi:hypothetical protein
MHLGNLGLKACVCAEDAKLADAFDALYQASIDRGGHPNERGLSASGRMLDRDATVESSFSSFCCIRTRDG